MTDRKPYLLNCASLCILLFGTLCLLLTFTNLDGDPVDSRTGIVAGFSVICLVIGIGIFVFRRSSFSGAGNQRNNSTSPIQSLPTADNHAVELSVASLATSLAMEGPSCSLGPPPSYAEVVKQLPAPPSYTDVEDGL